MVDSDRYIDAATIIRFPDTIYNVFLEVFRDFVVDFAFYQYADTSLALRCQSLEYLTYTLLLP